MLTTGRETAGTILVVDDDPDVREGLCDFLAEEGYAVSEAQDGEMALKVLHDSQRPDVVLLDLRMPGMDGYEFLARRQADQQLRNVPVIVISATPEPARMIYPVTANLVKPVDLRKLVEILNQQIPKSAPQMH